MSETGFNTPSNSAPASQITVQVLNNNGGGFAGDKKINAGTTVGTLFLTEVGGNPGDYKIRVNREAVAADYVLKEGDRVSFTAGKLTGAC
jgi:sulfur carrier protein ThiS